MQRFWPTLSSHTSIYKVRWCQNLGICCEEPFFLFVTVNVLGCLGDTLRVSFWGHWFFFGLASLVEASNCAARNLLVEFWQEGCRDVVGWIC